MTVIAWDGNTLAADRQATISGLVVETRKLVRCDDLDNSGVICGFTGPADFGHELVEWYLSGADKSKWPDFQKTKDWCRLVVFDRKLFFYEQSSTPIPVHHNFIAFGSGRDFAMAALYLGKSAVDAVSVASALCDTCGCGVDFFDAVPL